MQEDELVAEIRRLAFDQAGRTTMAQEFPWMRRSFPEQLPRPATSDTVAYAVGRMGFALPSLLCRLWVEVANGGFGPGYGLFGLEGGHQSNVVHETLPDLYLNHMDDPAWEQAFDEPWPKRLVPICDWGCLTESAIDCSTREGEVVDLIDGWERKPRGVTFAEWMEQWVNGADVSIFGRKT